MHIFVSEVRENGMSAALRAGVVHVRQLVAVDETHSWFEQQLEADTGQETSGTGLQLVEGASERLPLLGQLPTVSAAVAARRLEEGVRWWLLLDGLQPVFSCWTFSRFMPMMGAPRGAVVLPPDVVFLEDSVTNPARRGSGFGPVALMAVAGRLHEEGTRWWLTKVKVGNRAADRLVVKAGFAPFATVRIWRMGPLRKTWVSLAQDGVNRWLPTALEAVG
jgi:hypothetical protein